jgi:hypothetical protein
MAGSRCGSHESSHRGQLQQPLSGRGSVFNERRDAVALCCSAQRITQPCASCRSCQRNQWLSMTRIPVSSSRSTTSSSSSESSAERLAPRAQQTLSARPPLPPQRKPRRLVPRFALTPEVNTAEVTTAPPSATPRTQTPTAETMQSGAMPTPRAEQTQLGLKLLAQSMPPADSSRGNTLTVATTPRAALAFKTKTSPRTEPARLDSKAPHQLTPRANSPRVEMPLDDIGTPRDELARQRIADLKKSDRPSSSQKTYRTHTSRAGDKERQPKSEKAPKSKDQALERGRVQVADTKPETKSPRFVAEERPPRTGQTLFTPPQVKRENKLPHERSSTTIANSTLEPAEKPMSVQERARIIEEREHQERMIRQEQERTRATRPKPSEAAHHDSSERPLSKSRKPDIFS